VLIALSWVMIEKKYGKRQRSSVKEAEMSTIYAFLRGVRGLLAYAPVI